LAKHTKIQVRLFVCQIIESTGLRDDIEQLRVTARFRTHLTELIDIELGNNNLASFTTTPTTAFAFAFPASLGADLALDMMPSIAFTAFFPL